VFKGTKVMKPEIIDEIDLQGNTPLLLAAKLTHGD
jgi:hypothetical protein